MSRIFFEERPGLRTLFLMSVASLSLGFAAAQEVDEDDERVFAGVSEPGCNFKIAASYQFGN